MKNSIFCEMETVRITCGRQFENASKRCTWRLTTVLTTNDGTSLKIMDRSLKTTLIEKQDYLFTRKLWLDFQLSKIAVVERVKWCCGIIFNKDFMNAQARIPTRRNYIKKSDNLQISSLNCPWNLNEAKSHGGSTYTVIILWAVVSGIKCNFLLFVQFSYARWFRLRCKY